MRVPLHLLNRSTAHHALLDSHVKTTFLPLVKLVTIAQTDDQRYAPWEAFHVVGMLRVVYVTLGSTPMKKVLLHASPLLMGMYARMEH